MKSFIFFPVLLFLLINISCTSDELKEDLSDIPDWDYANAVNDETSGETDNSEDETSDNTVEQPDENTNQADQEETTDDSGTIQGCGNEKVEYEERCDSTVPLTCSSLNPGMNGVTYCMNNCQGYDMQSCGRNDKTWGLLNLRFLSNFILDEAKIGDFSYFSKGAIPYAAFNGIYGDNITIFPATGQNTSFAVTTNYQGTFTTKRQLTIKQNAVDGGAIGYPRHELEFSPGTISKGSEYRINAVTVFDLIDNLLKLVRYRLIEKKNGIECIMGIGYSGTVYITNIVPDNADLFDGGIIEVVANNVDFFHPSEFPGLDEENPEVPAEILKYPVCDK
jgi:hypothetical protein